MYLICQQKFSIIFCMVSSLLDKLESAPDKLKGGVLMQNRENNQNQRNNQNERSNQNQRNQQNQNERNNQQNQNERNQNRK